VSAALSLAPTTPPVARDLAIDQRDAIDHAVRVAGGHLSAERRWDLRQDLALVLCEHRVPHGASLEGWLVVCARNLVADEDRKEARRREILEESHELGGPRTYRKGPTWYPPHADAEEFAPFACMGARVIHHKRPVCLVDVETAFAQWIDAGGSGRRRVPTCPVDRVAEEAIQKRRARAYKSTGTSKVRASSFMRGRNYDS
jgi:hypothetical protein